jgi:beta-lactamase class A
MRRNILDRELITRFFGSLTIAGILAALVASQTPGAAGKNDGAAGAKLEQHLAALAGAHRGHVAAYAKQLNTGRVVAIDANQPVQTASVIKLAILFEVMEQVRSGKA